MLPIFVMSYQFCLAVRLILPGPLTDFEMGIFLSLRLILCNVMLSVGCLQKSDGRPGKISRTAKIRPILAVHVDDPGKYQIKVKMCVVVKNARKEKKVL